MGRVLDWLLVGREVRWALVSVSFPQERGGHYTHIHTDKRNGATGGGKDLWRSWEAVGTFVPF